MMDNEVKEIRTWSLDVPGRDGVGCSRFLLGLIVLGVAMKFVIWGLFEGSLKPDGWIWLGVIFLTGMTLDQILIRISGLRSRLLHGLGYLAVMGLVTVFATLVIWFAFQAVFSKAYQ